MRRKSHEEKRAWLNGGGVARVHRHMADGVVLVPGAERVQEIVRDHRSGTAAMISGPCGSGKTRLLELYLRRHPKPREDVSGLRGVVFSAGGRTTTAAFAAALANALDPGLNVSEVGIEKQSVISAMGEIHGSNGIVCVDDVEELLREDGTMEDGVARLLRILVVSRPTILCGRDPWRVLIAAEIAAGPHARLEPMTDDEELKAALVELERMGGFETTRSYFDDPRALRAFIDQVPTRAIAGYAEIMRCATLEAGEERGLTGKMVAAAIGQVHGSMSVYSRLAIRKPRPFEDVDSLVIPLRDTIVQSEGLLFRFGGGPENLRPRDGIWEIPVDSVVHVPIVSPNELEHIATVTMRFPGVRREDEIYRAPCGTLFVERYDEDPAAALADSILSEADQLVGSCDEPAGLQGFPWAETTAEAATARIAQNVEKALPNIASRYRVCSDGRVFRKVDHYGLFLVASRDGSYLSYSDDEETEVSGCLFDLDELQELRAISALIDARLGREVGDPARGEPIVVREHVPGALPRRAFSNLLGFVAKEIGDILTGRIPPDVGLALRTLRTCKGRPDADEHEAIGMALEVLNGWIPSGHRPIDPDSGVDLIWIAQKRNALLAARKPAPMPAREPAGVEEDCDRAPGM